MIPMRLKDIAKQLNGQLHGGDLVVEHVSTDTRQISDNSLFIALVGERFDGHQFAGQAIEQGASALLVERYVEGGSPQIVVADTRQALGQLGAYVHRQCHDKTVAITGSCGKTTVKEMVASILGQKGRVLFTQGNFNNDIGVPLTLLRSTPNDDYAVIELGANHIGEIALTTQWVQPDIALVNNVAAAHLEGFGSIDGVKQAKGEIYQGLSEQGVALVNLDSHGEDWWQTHFAKRRVITLSVQQPADYGAQNVVLNAQGCASFTLKTPLGEQDIALSLLGQHNVSNAIAASAIAIEMGATLSEVASGLQLVKPVKGRVNAQQLTDKINLIDDSYNASVPAMLAAVDVLASFASERWLILGNMAELGQQSLELHRQVGEYAAQFAFEQVLTFGEEAKVISEVCQGRHFSCHQSMIDYIEQQLAAQPQAQHTLLIKGANSAGMYNVADALKENYA
ncbi:MULTISPECIES: UDP-N-acetylmuramoyl-tripeptide--D-alanyl-D-alanine ligase [unclassified Vibrio]|uniref:UDP-N-acetylmuramoyl-tripeptide--D-alanyl-D-alanine ligase n=1 Tax=Vibrio sp. HB236076 TaxID=3232307 RepID=A0AB39HH62_9VIBR|nr:UDP-N-acetylmuramoyl-tripeptide--D-alanyl-D-alanine ligase [Vibrio sp. HB161653]MDP5254541.1 UDP-N-acetylmuramoyl-tripeptide--D-alanyl-D-alanine ligase [Vibrio sp. HB161653]